MALEAVHQRCMERDEVDRLSSVESLPNRESLRSSISRALALGEGARWTVAEAGQEIVGHGRIACWPERDGTWVYLALGRVVPEWRARGIGTAMLRRAEDHIRKLAAADHPGEAAEFAANASSTEREATELLLHEGYRAAFTVLEMGLAPTRPLPQPVTPLPSGLEIRPVTPDHRLLIAESVCAACRAGYEAGRYDSGSDPAASCASSVRPGTIPTYGKWVGRATPSSARSCP